MLLRSQLHCQFQVSQAIGPHLHWKEVNLIIIAILINRLPKQPTPIKNKMLLHLIRAIQDWLFQWC